MSNNRNQRSSVASNSNDEASSNIIVRPPLNPLLNQRRGINQRSNSDRTLSSTYSDEENEEIEEDRNSSKKGIFSRISSVFRKSNFSSSSRQSLEPPINVTHITVYLSLPNNPTIHVTLEELGGITATQSGLFFREALKHCVKDFIVTTSEILEERKPLLQQHLDMGLVYCTFFIGGQTFVFTERNVLGYLRGCIRKGVEPKFTLVFRSF